MNESDPWMPRGWVGRAEVIGPFKTAIDAALMADVGAVSPPRTRPPSVVDEDGALLGFAIACRPDYPITVPEGATGMARPVALALLAALAE